MPRTARLGLPLVAAAQAQKHVTVNEALTRLDAVVHLTVADRDIAAPPVAPADDGRWIVPAAPSGAWAGHGGEIAWRLDGAWSFIEPAPGWLCWVEDEGVLLRWTGSAWVYAAPAATATGAPRLPSHTVAAMPSATPAGQLVYVSDGASTKRLAVSDGAAWRWPDGGIVS